MISHKMLTTTAICALGGALGLLAWVLHVPAIIAFPAIYCTAYVIGYYSN